VPGFGAYDLTPGHTLTDYLDRLLIPGKLYEGDRDPEGLLATIPAIGTALAGAVTGQLLKNNRYSDYMKLAIMVLVGVACLGLARLWNLEFPINKNLWTSSFVLRCAGWSLLILSFFYLVIDVWKFRAWAFPFVVIGSNSILIYLADRCVNFEHAATFLFGGMLKNTGAYQPLLSSLAIVFVEWLLLFFFYKQRIFLRV
jgi:predicted acyltransferase